MVPLDRFQTAIESAVFCQKTTAVRYGQAKPRETRGKPMKMIFAIIQPTRLRALKQALTSIGVNRITICDAQEFAKHTDREPVYRGMEYRTDILRKITLEIAVNDDFLERTIKTIETVARTGPTGSDGDGKIFVLHIESAIVFEPEVRGPGAI